jgi:hypothetical protein
MNHTKKPEARASSFGLGAATGAEWVWASRMQKFSEAMIVVSSAYFYNGNACLT